MVIIYLIVFKVGIWQNYSCLFSVQDLTEKRVYNSVYVCVYHMHSPSQYYHKIF